MNMNKTNLTDLKIAQCARSYSPGVVTYYLAIWGWVIWCCRDLLGVADSRRKDVKYDKFKGVLLDRERVELLKLY